jgi:antitoxin YefM
LQGRTPPEVAHNAQAEGALRVAPNTGLRPIKRGTGGARLRQVVTIIRVMSETLPLAQIKAHLSEIVDRVEHEHERVVLTRNGRPAAVLISPDDLEALEETLSILSDPKAMRAIRKAEADLDSGNVVTADELRAKYLQR